MSISKRFFETQEDTKQEVLSLALASVRRIEYLLEIDFETLDAWTHRLHIVASQIETIIQDARTYTQ